MIGLTRVCMGRDGEDADARSLAAASQGGVSVGAVRSKRSEGRWNLGVGVKGGRAGGGGW